MEVNSAYRSFSSGVIGKSARGRSDRPFYQTGLEVCQNFIPFLSGLAEYRSGFVRSLKTRHNQPAVLYPFIFNDSVAYLLEFTDLAIRIFKDDGVVLETAVDILDITQADPAVVTTDGAHSYSNDDEVYISGVVGMEEVNNRIFRVANKTADTFELTSPEGDDIDSTAYTAYSSAGESARAVTITSPYELEDLYELGMAQAPEVKYIDHTAYAPRKLTSTDDTTWSLSTYTRIADPFPGANEYPGATGFYGGRLWHGGTINGPDRAWGSRGPDIPGADALTLSAATVGVGRTATAADYGNFTEGDIGKQLKDSSGGVATVTAYTNSKIVTIEITSAFGSTSVGAGDWYLYDSTGMMNFDDFTGGVKANDAITFALNSQGDYAEQIRFFRSNPKFLAIGAFGGVYKAYGESEGKAISPTAINVVPVDDYGCAKIAPLFSGTQVAYVERGGKKLRSFEYSWTDDDYDSQDKSQLSEDLIHAGLKQITYTSGTPEIVWGVTTDNKLVSCTLKSKEEVAAWAPHPIGGSGEVLSVCGIPRVDNNDRLWICVKRGTEYFLEYKSDTDLIIEESTYYTGTAATDKRKYLDLLFEQQRRIIRLDSAIVWDGTQTIALTIDETALTATAASALFASGDEGKRIQVKYLAGGETGLAQIVTINSSTEVDIELLEAFSETSLSSGEWYLTTNTIKGLWDYEGEELSIVADGMVGADVTVSSGQVSLAYYTAYAVLGYKYVGLLVPLYTEPQNLSVPTAGRTLTFNKIVIDLQDTLGLKCGASNNRLYEVSTVPYRKEGVSEWNRPVALFTGSKKRTIRGGSGIKKNPVFIQDSPMPCRILGYTVFMDVDLEGET
jgi:hypothetical protein